MASRETLSEIQALEKNFKQSYPNLTFVIDHEKGECPMYPGAIEAQGLHNKVVRWDGDTPIVRWERWDIHELVTCPECGEEWRNKAIGSGSLCSGCLENMRISRDPRTDAEVRADTANEIARDLHRERWCQ